MTKSLTWYTSISENLTCIAHAYGELKNYSELLKQPKQKNSCFEMWLIDQVYIKLACKWRLKVLNHDRRNEKKSNREVWLRTFQTYFTFFPYSFEMLKWILFGYLKPPLNATIWISEDTFLTCVILTWFCFHLERSIYVPISFCSVFSLFFCYRPFIST